MNNANKGWLEAAKIFATNPHAKITCPECNVGEIVIKDEISKDQKKLDRYLVCNSCGKWNVITMSLPRTDFEE